MKKWVGCLLLLIVPVLSSGEGPNKDSHYQLIQAKLKIPAMGAAFEGDTLFKIDTQTGKTWIYAFDASDVTRGVWAELENMDYLEVRKAFKNATPYQNR